MFTGIIEELGTVANIQRRDHSVQLTIRATIVLEDAKVGDSISVNGACLTVVELYRGTFSVDLAGETLAKTTFSELRLGHKVNLERALRLDSRLGGHLVTGHIDGTGKIVEKREQGNGFLLRISAPPEVMDYLVPRGSIAVDGVSLTVVDYSQGSFTVTIIPHTARLTTLGFKRIGEGVNLETDLLGKYVERLLSRHGKEDRITEEFLMEKGFTP